MQSVLFGKRFTLHETIKKWFDKWIESWELELFNRTIRLLPERWVKVIAFDGKYFEWNNFVCFYENKQQGLLKKKQEHIPIPNNNLKKFNNEWVPNIESNKKFISNFFLKKHFKHLQTMSKKSVFYIRSIVNDFLTLKLNMQYFCPSFGYTM